MKAFFVLTTVILALGFFRARAQEDTAHHRAVDNDIHGKTGSLKGKVSVKAGESAKTKETAAPAKAKEKAVAGKTVEGTFLGLEMGDYGHWNMKTTAGEEVSYFILSPDKSVDKVADHPKAFIGKKCRVVTKTSMENIPEAGGKIQIEQILSVEWLGKK